MAHSFFQNPNETIENVKSVVQNQVKTTVQATTQQLTGTAGSPQTPGSSIDQQLNQDFIRDMYEPTSMSKPHMQGSAAQSTPGAPQIPENIADQQALAAKRKELEFFKSNYYAPTFERPKQEERVADRIEREENDERWKLQEKEKKENKLPSALMNANNRVEHRGSAG